MNATAKANTKEIILFVPFYSCCLSNLCPPDSEDTLHSQGDQGELHITAAQAGVEQREPQAAKG